LISQFCHALIAQHFAKFGPDSANCIYLAAANALLVHHEIAELILPFLLVRLVLILPAASSADLAQHLVAVLTSDQCEVSLARHLLAAVKLLLALHSDARRDTLARAHMIATSRPQTRSKHSASSSSSSSSADTQTPYDAFVGALDLLALGQVAQLRCADATFAWMLVEQDAERKFGGIYDIQNRMSRVVDQALSAKSSSSSSLSSSSATSNSSLIQSIQKYQGLSVDVFKSIEVCLLCFS
jgi:hypothetical protein